MNGIELTVAISAGTYFTNKFLNYWCTPPAELSGNPGMFETFQYQGDEISLWFENKLGTRAWSIISDVIVDNAWISTLVLGIILETSPQLPINPLTKALVLVSAGITFCLIAWATRAVLALITPHAAELFVNVISPRPLRSATSADLDGIDQVFNPPLDPMAETNPYVP